jgi:AbiV family abortive infection protein
MDIPEGFYLEGYKLTLENAQNLQDTAELAYRKKSYGTARSLNVLSAQEGIKAMFLLLKHVFPNAQILDYDNAFANHNLNHAHIENFIAVYDLTMEKFYDSIAPQWKSFTDVKKKPFSARKKVHPQFDLLYTACEHIMEYKQREITLQHIVDWLKTADTDKMEGLFIGLHDNQWKAPKDTDPQQYVQEKRLAKEVHLMAEQIELIYRQLNTWLK